MDKQQAVELLREALAEIPRLRELQHDNQQFKLWKDRVELIIREGLDKDDIDRFSVPIRMYVDWGDASASRVARENYLKTLDDYDTALRKTIQKYELLGFGAELPVVVEPSAPKAFIAHGGRSPARDKLSSFLNALGITPVFAEDEPSEGRSIDENVEYHLRQCNCAIILATKGDVDGRTGKFTPRGNVLIEVGRFQELFPNRMVYLLEEDASFPTNIAEKVWERFSQDNMENALIKVARELRAFGLIKAVKA